MNSFLPIEASAFLNDFTQETLECLDAAEIILDRLKELPSDQAIDDEWIHDLFRRFHSIKGAAAFLKLDSIGHLTHEAECLLDLIRKGSFSIDDQVIELLDHSAALLRLLVERILATSSDKGLEVQVEQLVQALRELPRLITRAVEFRTSDDLPFFQQQGIAFLVRRLYVVERSLSTSLNDSQLSPLKPELMENLFVVLGLASLLGKPEIEQIAKELCLLARKLTHEKSNITSSTLSPIVRVLTIFRKTLVEWDILNEDHRELAPLLSLIRELNHHEHAELSEEGRNRLGQIMLDLGLLTREKLDQALQIQSRPLGEILLQIDAVREEELQVGLEAQKAQRQLLPQPDTATEQTSLRISLAQVERLSNLVGELVITQNMLTHHPMMEQPALEPLRRLGGHFNRTSREIQDLVLGLRRIPLAGQLHKIARICRDLAKQLGKNVEILTLGETTEADRNVSEWLANPLLHLMRNAIDHGVETPEERLQSGKPERARFRVEAKDESGEILIEIEDDGRGIDPKKILTIARSRGLVAPEWVPDSDEQVLQFLFAPGFSTAEKVTEISGRGVGLDVVKKNIEEQLRGSVSVQSVLGKGTLFRLRIPLTLTIIDGMLVRLADSVFALPLPSIRECFQLDRQIITRLPDQSMTIRVRDSILPLLDLVDFFESGEPREVSRGGMLIVVECVHQKGCLFVDEIVGMRQLVLKKCTGFLEQVRGLGGVSILSNGEISLVIDTCQLFRAAGIGHSA